MKRDAKIVSVLLAIAMMATMGLSGCGQAQTTTTTAAPVTITAMYAIAGFEDANAQAISEFELKYPNINVEHMPFADADITPVLQAKMAANALPDLFTINCDAFGIKMADEGWAADLKDTQCAQDTLEACKGPFTSPGGKLFGIPFGNATCFMYYNKDLFTQAGVTDAEIPKDWDSFIAVCKKIKDAGIVPIIAGTVMMGNTYFSFGFAQNVVSKDPDWNKKMKDGTFNFDSPEIIDMFEKWLQLKDYVQPGAVSTDYTAAQTLFVQGKGAMNFGGSWQASLYSDSATNGFECGSFIPVFNAPGETGTYASSPETGMGISGKTTNLDAAKKYLDFYLDEKYSIVQKARGSIPHLKNAVGVEIPPVISKTYSDMIKLTTVGQLHFSFMPGSLATGDDVAKIWQGLLMGEFTPQEAAKNLQELYLKTFED